MYQELLEATLLDIKKIVLETPNDNELGKKIRAYFNGLPKIMENFKENLNFDDSHNNGY